MRVFARGIRNAFKVPHPLNLLALIMATLMVCSQVKGAEGSFDLSDITSGQLLMRSDTSLSSAILLSTKVDIDISGTISRTKISQRFINTGNQWVEGVYVFPIGENAAVDRLKMRIGDRFIEGTIKEKEKARQVFETAKSEGKKAALIEQTRPNIFTNTVSNIAPNEIVIVQIEYQQKLMPKDGRWELRIPLTVTPRYKSSGLSQYLQFLAEVSSDKDMTLTQVSSAPEIPQKYPRNGEIINPVDITVNLDPGFKIENVSSPYHDIGQRQISASNHKIFMVGPVESNKDFLLRWSSESNEAGVSIFKEKHAGLEHAVLTLMPPQNLSTDAVPSREIIFVQDLSGSMSGQSLEQSKLGLELALERLKPTDSFNMVFFSDKFSSYSAQPVRATPIEINKALAVVRRLRTDGGTEMYPALSHALDNFSATAGTLRQLIFLTDGAVDRETALFSLIAKKLGNTRLFTIGIGSAPNSYFMTRSAEIGRGTSIQIGEIDEVAQRMDELFAKIENPAITDLTITLPEGINSETYPNPIPDLYAGDPVSISLRAKSLIGEAIVSGKKGDANWSISVPLEQFSEHNGVAKLWAKDKITSLENRSLSSFLPDTDQNKIKTEILKTSLSYGLVSSLTSLVAVDTSPSKPDGIKLSQERIASALPYGWDEHVFDLEKNHDPILNFYRKQTTQASIHQASLKMQSSEISLPDTSLNWKINILVGLAITLLGLSFLSCSRVRKNA